MGMEAILMDHDHLYKFSIGSTWSLKKFGPGVSEEKLFKGVNWQMGSDYNSSSAQVSELKSYISDNIYLLGQPHLLCSICSQWFYYEIFTFFIQEKIYLDYLTYTNHVLIGVLCSESRPNPSHFYPSYLWCSDLYHSTLISQTNNPRKIGKFNFW